MSKNESKASLISNDAGSIISGIQDLGMKKKSSIDVARVKTGRNWEEIMSTRGKALVLKFDEKAKSERVNFF